VDGSISGSQVIVLNQTVGIPTDLFQPRGVTFDRIHAVSQDGFVSVNSGVAGQVPAFSTPKIVGPFTNNNNQVTVSFVLASARGTATVAAATRGFGAICLDVETPDSTSPPNQGFACSPVAAGAGTVACAGPPDPAVARTISAETAERAGRAARPLHCAGMMLPPGRGLIRWRAARREAIIRALPTTAGVPPDPAAATPPVLEPGRQ
jgi:hypothetical protein